MPALIDKIKDFLAVVTTFLKPVNTTKVLMWLLLAVFLAFALVLLLSSCTSNHYFSLNADEIVNPSIVYQDSTNLDIPF